MKYSKFTSPNNQKARSAVEHDPTNYEGGNNDTQFIGNNISTDSTNSNVLIIRSKGIYISFNDV
jgi:hypothetical protein